MPNKCFTFVHIEFEHPVCLLSYLVWEAFNNYVDKIRGEGGQKMSVFVHAQGIKTVHAEGRGSKNGKILST
jgi:hypothetical protein